jgi:hypothetical protein
MLINVNTGRKDILMQVCEVKDSQFAVVTQRYAGMEGRMLIRGDHLILKPMDVSDDFYEVYDLSEQFMGYIQSAALVSEGNEEAFIAPVRYFKPSKEEASIDKVESVPVQGDSEPDELPSGNDGVAPDGSGEAD